jgi:DNA-binding beta-propeller fold protein YncE
MFRPRVAVLLVLVLFGSRGAAVARSGETAGPPVYRSPAAVAFSPDGQRLAVADVSAQEVVFLAVASAEVVARVKLSAAPTDLAWTADGKYLYVAVPLRSCVVEIDAPAARIWREVRAGLRPVGVALARRQNLLVVSDLAADEILLIDRGSGGARARLPAVRQPATVVLAPSGEMGTALNLLPLGDASQPKIAAAVNLFTLIPPQKLVEVFLPPNAVNLRGSAISPDGRWAYVAHNLARSTIPTTQIEYGWINANALSIIDLGSRKHCATVLLDQAECGAADPWGVAISPVGDTLWVALSGVHRLARLDLRRLHAALGEALPRVADQPHLAADPPVAQYITGHRAESVDDPTAVELAGLKPSAYGMGYYLPGVIQRLELPGLGPRGLAIDPGGKILAVAMYFSGTVVLVDGNTGRIVRQIAMGPQPPADPARRGEIAFHDARLCYQQWLSCATCHPDGRADGLNWDLMNDGAGNPKNTRSLVFSHRTGPMMARGVRESFSEAVAAGFTHILFRPATPQIRGDVEAYLRALRPEPSPFLVEGGLSATARRGQALFADPEVGCARCHCGELFTDEQAHDVGTRVADDWDGEERFLTPKLVELWRTSPYLHHGKAVNLREVLTKYNPRDRHGRTSHLSEAEITALVEYLKSL